MLRGAIGRDDYMSTKVPLKNALHILQLKEQMDEVVFNYIDTSQKWEVAYSELDVLLEKTTGYFESYMEASGDKPEGNTTAVLFLNVAYKLIYFHTISYYHLEETDQAAVRDKVLDLLTLAAKCIPDVHKENNAEYLGEIAKSYEEISREQGNQQGFNKVILEKKPKIEDCFAHFSEAKKLFLK